MTELFLGCALLVMLFGSVVFFGAPYLPTLKRGTTEALDLLNLKPGQVLVELGSGDGRVLRAAASRDIKAIGYEINPILVLYSRLRCMRQRKLITIRWANYWRVPLPACDGIYVFLFKTYMSKLDKKIIIEAQKPLKLVSFAFTIPNRKPIKQKNGLFLYRYK